MANRRMFSRTVTGSGRFLRLGAQTRALYFDLGMEADDDGFVEAYARMLSTGSKTRNLKELLEAGFLEMVDEKNLVVHITDWEENNVIRKDRYTPSVYRKRLAQQTEAPKDDPQPEPEQPEPAPQTEPNTKAEPSTQAATQPSEAAPQAEATGVTDGCFLGDSRLTQVRLGKDRLGKVSLGKDSLGQVRSAQDRAGEERTGYGERGTLPAGAREEKQKTALQKQGEFEIEYTKKKENAVNMLLNSKYFSGIPASS